LDVDAAMESLLQDAQRLCHRQGATLIIVGHGGRRGDVFNERCERICARTNILFFNLTEQMQPYEKVSYLKNDGHYSVEGNKIAAKILYEYLKKRKLLND
jgi:hypothetical protein